MTKENLNRAIQLQKEISELQKMINDTKNHKCEWIDFNYGNGSDDATVTDDKELIEELRERILDFNEGKLNRLQDEFDSL